MVRDFHLKDCIGSEVQTPSGYRDDIIARIRGMLGTSMQSIISEEDCQTLRSMLRMTETLQGQRAINEGQLLEKLGEVAKAQFSLQPQTRRQLARVIRVLPAQWLLKPELHGDGPKSKGKMILAVAQLKVLTYLTPPTTKDKPLLDFIQLVSTEISNLEPPGARGNQTHQVYNRKVRSKKLATMNGNLNIAQERAIARVAGSRDQCSKGSPSVQMQQHHDRLFSSHQFWSRFAEYAEVFKANCGNMVPTALSVPTYRTVQLDACFKILDRGFLMPNQLLEKTTQLECELEIPGAFEDIKVRIAEHHQTLLALATEEMVLAHVFDHSEVLLNLHSEVETIVCLSFRAKGKHSQRGNEVLPNNKHSIANLSGVKTPTLIEPSQPAKVLHSNKDATKIRSVSVAQWHFKTRLDDLTLNDLLENQMDAGTFADVWHSVAYHVNKHAPEMLVEDYLRESQKLFTDHWIGQIERRLAIRCLEGNIVRQKTSDLWAKIVHCSMGDGCYSWRGRTIWYHPPDH